MANGHKSLDKLTANSPAIDQEELWEYDLHAERAQHKCRGPFQRRHYAPQTPAQWSNTTNTAYFKSAIARCESW